MLLFTWLLLFHRYLNHERVACIISPIGACSLYFYSCFMGELAPLNRSVEGHRDLTVTPSLLVLNSRGRFLPSTSMQRKVNAGNKDNELPLMLRNSGIKAYLVCISKRWGFLYFSTVWPQCHVYCDFGLYICIRNWVSI